MFRDALGRSPDAGSLNWGTQLLDQGVLTETLAGNIVGSPEHATKVVEAAYRQCLGRDAEPAALAFWSAALSANTGDEQLIASLVASEEFYLRAGGTNAAWAAAAYQVVLGRPARASDVLAVNSMLAAGLPRGIVALGLATSLEHEQAVVAEEYNQYLHTTPDTKILLVSILPADPLPIQPMPTVNAVNQSISALADGRTVFYLDAGAYFTNQDGTLKQALYQPLLVHLNATGYAVLAGAIAPKLQTLLVPAS